MPICKYCKTKFIGRTKACPDCINLIGYIETRVLLDKVKKDNYDWFNQFDYELYTNDINGGYIWVNINLKDYCSIIDNNNDNINSNSNKEINRFKEDCFVKFFYKKCLNCESYVYTDNKKGKIKPTIESIKNNQAVTCSRTCQNQYKIKAGMNFICKYCGTSFRTNNPRIYSCKNCDEIIDTIYNQYFKQTIYFTEIDKWLATHGKNIVKHFKNDYGGEYYVFRCYLKDYGVNVINNNDNNKNSKKLVTYLDFYYKVCVVCGDFIRIDDHIDRKINHIENEKGFTACSISHANEFKNKYLAENNLIKCTCKNCRQEFNSNNQNTYYCNECRILLEKLINNFNSQIIDSDEKFYSWIKNVESTTVNKIEILEEYENEVGSKYKLVRYCNDFTIFFKQCFRCKKLVIQNNYYRTIEAIKNNVNVFCSKYCSDRFYNIGFKYLIDLNKANEIEINNLLKFNGIINDTNNNTNDFSDNYNYNKSINNISNSISNLICKKHQENRIFYYDENVDKYVCWQCYKEENFEYKLINKCLCKQCGKLLDNPLNQNFCNDKCKNQFEGDKYKVFKHNNLEKCSKHPNEELSYKGKCWNCIKDRIINKEIIQNIDLINFTLQIQQDYQNNTIFIQQTFRTQDSKDWSGGAKQIFEQSLVEKEITWFAYIKFYIKTNDKNYIKPLVVGKSGSKEVNSQGSDVNFSENVEDGPARRLLYDSNGLYSWDKTKILIISCNSEEEALKIEKEIKEKYNLFYS